MSKSGTPQEIQARAEERFKKAEQLTQESDRRVEEGKAAEKALDTKTAGLKAQRLARDAAEAAARSKAGPKRQPRLVANPDEVKGG